MKIKIENNIIYNLIFILDEKINMKKKEIDIKNNFLNILILYFKNKSFNQK